MQKQSAREKVFSAVTEQLWNLIQSDDTGNWIKGWVANYNSQYNAATGNVFTNTNASLLSLIAGSRGYGPAWVHISQLRKSGVRVEKTVFNRRVYVLRPIIINTEVEDKDTGEKVKKSFLKGWAYYDILNVDELTDKQKTALPLSFREKPELPDKVITNAELDALVSEYLELAGGFIQGKNDKAYYQPQADRIHLPAVEQFNSTAEYYGTLLHEAVHATGHQSRLNREGITKAYTGLQDYSQEELVAETSAAILAEYLGLKPDLRNSAAYLKGWAKNNADANEALITGFREAGQAVQFILDLLDVPEPVTA